jgi:hypothetical protein
VLVACSFFLFPFSFFLGCIVFATSRITIVLSPHHDHHDGWMNVNFGDGLLVKPSITTEVG